MEHAIKLALKDIKEIINLLFVINALIKIAKEIKQMKQ